MPKRNRFRISFITFVDISTAQSENLISILTLVFDSFPENLMAVITLIALISNLACFISFDIRFPTCVCGPSPTLSAWDNPVLYLILNISLHSFWFLYSFLYKSIHLSNNKFTFNSSLEQMCGIASCETVITENPSRLVLLFVQIKNKLIQV